MASELLFSGSDDFLCGVCDEEEVLGVDAQGEEELEEENLRKKRKGRKLDGNEYHC